MALIFFKVLNSSQPWAQRFFDIEEKLDQGEGRKEKGRCIFLKSRLFDRLIEGIIRIKTQSLKQTIVLLFLVFPVMLC